MLVRICIADSYTHEQGKVPGGLIRYSRLSFRSMWPRISYRLIFRERLGYIRDWISELRCQLRRSLYVDTDIYLCAKYTHLWQIHILYNIPIFMYLCAQWASKCLLIIRLIVKIFMLKDDDNIADRVKVTMFFNNKIININKSRNHFWNQSSTANIINSFTLMFCLFLFQYLFENSISSRPSYHKHGVEE